MRDHTDRFVGDAFLEAGVARDRSVADHVAHVRDVPVDAVQHRAYLVARLRDRLAHLARGDACALLEFHGEQVAERSENRRAIVVGTRRPGGLRGAGAADLLGDLPGLGDRHRAQQRRRSRGCGSRANAVGQARARAVEPARTARPAPAPARRRAGAGRSSAGTRSCIHRASFWPGRRSNRCANPMPARRPSASSTSSNDRNECQRSVRCFSSPGVCAPRSSNTPSSVDSGRSRPSASSATWRCLIDALAGRLHSPRQLLLAQPVERALDRRLAVLDDRLPVRGLVARVHDRVHRERVVVGRGDRLLHQAPEDASFLGSQRDRGHRASAEHEVCDRGELRGRAGDDHRRDGRLAPYARESSRIFSLGPISATSCTSWSGTGRGGFFLRPSR